MRKGLTEEEVQAALGELADSGLPAATVTALRLADRLTSPEPHVDADLYGELRSHFHDDQILELGVVLSVGSGWQRFIEAFGIRPDHWSDEAPELWQTR